MLSGEHHFYSFLFIRKDYFKKTISNLCNFLKDSCEDMKTQALRALKLGFTSYNCLITMNFVIACQNCLHMFWSSFIRVTMKILSLLCDCVVVLAKSWIPTTFYVFAYPNIWVFLVPLKIGEFNQFGDMPSIISCSGKVFPSVIIVITIRKMCPNSFWVSLHFEWIRTFLPI